METAWQDQEVSAIRRVIADAERLQNDVEGFIRLLTQDVVIVNFGGSRVRGRNKVYRAMKQALETPLADVRTRNELADIRFLRPDVAVVSCIKHISDEREASPGQPNRPLADRGQLTFVLVKEQGRWLISTAQTTPIGPWTSWRRRLGRHVEGTRP